MIFIYAWLLGLDGGGLSGSVITLGLVIKFRFRGLRSCFKKKNEINALFLAQILTLAQGALR